MDINTTGYSSNQFLGLSNYETTPIARQVKDNPEFYFPGKRTPNIYDAPGTKPENNPQVQRGFIRGIFPEVIKKIQSESLINQKTANRYANLTTAPVRRCFFQFNPSLILRSVQASTTTLNPLLQDPAQLLQPIPGQASFEFQLLFNREHEVSAQEYIDANGVLQKTKPLTQNLADYGADPTEKSGGLPYSQDQLGDLGVLVDLYVLDSIIGQSITQDSLDSIKTYWEATKNLRPGEDLDKEGNPTQPYAGTNFLKDTKYQEGLEKVLGNSAFLNPMPIRIVFSSLFMVEGFVTASNVAFHKFSRNMVPTVCQVTLSVQAMYIGFAKEKSYVTEQLTESINNDVTNDEETSANINACQSLMKKEVFVELDSLKYGYTNSWSSQSTGLLPTLEDSPLNVWFKAHYDFYSAPGSKGVPQQLLDFGKVPDDQSSDLKSLNLYTSEEYKADENKSVQNLKIAHLDMFFYDAAKTPDWVVGTSEIIKEAEAGNLTNGNYKGLKHQGRSRFWWIDQNDYPGLERKKHLSDLSSDKFDKGTSKKAYKNHWYGDSLYVNGLDEDSLKTPDNYFGNKVYVVLLLTLSGESKAATGDNKTNIVYKATAATLDPNEEGIKDMPWIRFGTR